MKKLVRSTPGKSAPKAGAPAELPEELLADRLVALAVDLRDADVYKTLPDDLRRARAELRRTVNRCLQKRSEAALSEALERCWDEDAGAWRTLNATVEELAGTIIVRRPDDSELEVNAFAIPLFVHSRGGLDAAQCFRDGEAFDALRASIVSGGLESPDAGVVLVAHAYHADEFDRIGPVQLHAMVREAHEAMSKKKAAAAEAIAASMSGWPPSAFAAGDEAMELRFLLGFAQKSLDDPFYRIPEKEALADRYFEQRAQRFRRWSEDVTPLLKRCLATDGRVTAIDFLYQDLFHGARDAALRELEMLRLLTSVRALLDERGIDGGDARAIVGPLEAEDDEVMRIVLQMRAGDAPLGSVDRPLARSETVAGAVDDIADGLDSIGIGEIQVARQFDMEGMPLRVRPYGR